MDTSKMKLFEAFSNARNFLVLKEVEDLRSLAGNILESMEMALIRNQIIEALQDYDLGIVTDVYEIFGGYINRSFGVYTEKDGKQYEYFVRKYKKRDYRQGNPF
jgi:homoserine kinase type II